MGGVQAVVPCCGNPSCLSSQPRWQPAYPGLPINWPLKWLCVCVCVCAYVMFNFTCFKLLWIGLPSVSVGIVRNDDETWWNSRLSAVSSSIDEGLRVTGIIKISRRCRPFPTRTWMRCLPTSHGFVRCLTYWRTLACCLAEHVSGAWAVREREWSGKQTSRSENRVDGVGQKLDERTWRRTVERERSGERESQKSFLMRNVETAAHMLCCMVAAGLKLWYQLSRGDKYIQLYS